MRGMNRVFQGAATVDSILRDDTIALAADAGLRSLFVGFETLSAAGLSGAAKKQNLGRDYRQVVARLDDLGIMINGSFVFGLDGEDPDVFRRTVDWAVSSGITTATFHILTPYPGTALYGSMQAQGRLTTCNWDCTTPVTSCTARWASPRPHSSAVTTGPMARSTNGATSSGPPRGIKR
jgi:radical SAM superfamily enzyme YgiQ (UPF0313 family)